MWAPEVVCRNAIILLFVTQFLVCKGERGDGDQRSGAGDSDRVDTLAHLTSALSQQNSLAANKRAVSPSSNTLYTVKLWNCNNLLLVDLLKLQQSDLVNSWHVWSSLCRLWLRCNQTCSSQFISGPRTCTKFTTEPNIAYCDPTNLIRAWQQLLQWQEASLDKWPNFRCKNPPLGLLSQHDFEGRRKDSPRYTQFVLPHISWEVFWHTFQRNKVIKGESTFPRAHTSFRFIAWTEFCLFSECEHRVRCLVRGHYVNKIQPHEIMAFSLYIPNTFCRIFNPLSVHS